MLQEDWHNLVAQYYGTVQVLSARNVLFPFFRGGGGHPRSRGTSLNRTHMLLTHAHAMDLYEALHGGQQQQALSPHPHKVGQLLYTDWSWPTARRHLRPPPPTHTHAHTQGGYAAVL